MIIDFKIFALKTYLTEARLSNKGLKTTIDQTAVSTTEESNVELDLNSETHNSADSYSKKDENHKESQNNNEEEVNKITLTDLEIKEKNLKLLNLL